MPSELPLTTVRLLNYTSLSPGSLEESKDGVLLELKKVRGSVRLGRLYGVRAGYGTNNLALGFGSCSPFGIWTCYISLPVARSP